ncbi:MAG: ATP-binding protein [Oscillatoriaceae bacterium SKW80]|nr:ATP-binding protein [Oscillatoriaceae bacterium SKYG93]MCX8121714.1 ATP-binding protein [Oscillatoriaceae bacterium SKW80]MDW8453670.1 ATP-binding protein [Oscillatoriaceae cyanobacterium SKYGB_i_bin93]HIK28734.1 response regulator [Oscillatoriaceae cyanobacterium M7585_C2015_266]
MSKAKILIVEDETIIALDIKRTLINLGYAVPAVMTSAEKMLDKIGEIQPDIVLMDIMLKGSMDGVEAAERLRKLYQIPVVYLTAHTDSKTLQRAKETEPYGYIVKPFEEQDIYTTVEIALARSQAEAKIRKALEKEKELRELKNHFISIVSHEFRTPMSTILFSAGLLENYGNKLSEEKKVTHLQRIQTAVKQMTNLLDSVLTIGKAEANKLEFHPTAINLENFCSSLVEEMQLIAGEKYDISFSSQGDCTNALMDEYLLRHIFCNLLSNAVKYSPNGGKVKFQLTCEPSQQVAVFRIQDEGIGIPPEDRKHLFEIFHRASNVGNISGTGLGLAIVKHSVELHKGKITFDSEVGKGTTFTVTLPLQSHSD